MKKTFIVLAVMAALMFSAAPSQALLGIPDDVPGKDVLFPFLASIPGQGTLNTLMAMTDVYGKWGDDKLKNVFHYTVYTKRSETVFNDDLKGTKNDIVSTDALTIIGNMAPSQVAKLEVDLDGDKVNDHYAGYVYFENYYEANSVIAQIMLVDMPVGVATAANAPVKEYAPTAYCPQTVADVTSTIKDRYEDGLNKGMERFSASALRSGTTIQLTDAQVCADATGFALFPRYYITNPMGGKTILIIWKSDNAPATPTTASQLHVWFFNAEEKWVSSTIPLPDELNIIDIAPYLPLSLHPSYDPEDPKAKEGFIQILTPDTDGAGFNAAREWVGYAWMTDTNPVSSVDVLTSIHRDAW